MGKARKMWFILIGIDFYLPHKDTRRVIKYPNLKGAVKDIERMEDYIDKNLRNGETEVVKIVLKSPHPGNGATVHGETPESLPSRENIEAALERVITEAEDGEFLYYHYSGHGARVKTKYPDLSWKTKYDEAFVPYDICAKGTYLRDVEFHHYLERMYDKNLTVNIIIDCCHAGGATRGSGNSVQDLYNDNIRGINEPDNECTPEDEIEFEKFNKKKKKDLESMGTSKECERGVVISNSQEKYWMILPPGQALLAACHFDQPAREIYTSNFYCGAFTHFLLESLKHGNEVTLEHLQHNIQTLTANLGQIPIYAGESGNNIFGVAKAERLSSVVVIRSDEKKVIFDKGKAHDIEIGTIYQLFPWNYVKNSERLGNYMLVEVKTVGLFQSMAHFITDSSSPKSDYTGFQALEISRSADTSYHMTINFPAGCNLKRRNKKHRLSNALTSNQAKEIQLTKEPSKYSIDLDNGKYSLLSLDINRENTYRAVPGIPSLSDAGDFIKALQHIVSYNRMMYLEDKPRIEVDPPRVDPRSMINYTCSVREKAQSSLTGEYGDKEFSLEFKNTSTFTLYVSIFNFSPEWDITRLHPPKDGGGTQFDIIVEEDSRKIDFRLTSKPPGWSLEDPFIDYLKVIVTNEPQCFDCLEKIRLADIGGSTARYKSHQENQAYKPNNVAQSRERLSTTQIHEPEFTRGAYPSPPMSEPTIEPKWSTKLIEVATSSSTGTQYDSTCIVTYLGRLSVNTKRP